ncbi:MAG: putative tRNA pseudouridine synthase D [Candidatus Micrarchaeota archaeon]|nr:MAG: putative tRNA pseudouridine synthase D [Candidatus Micrarchaeota archaeon]
MLILKDKPEDFIVEEIALNGKILQIDTNISASDLGVSELDNGDYLVFVMQKRNWNTSQALRRIARYLSKGKKSFSFAGTKDRKAVTTQLCSIYKADIDKLKAMKIKDIKINGAFYYNKPVKLGDLLGNRFRIILRGEHKPVSDQIEQYGRFPNFFGEQRFGFRDNNVKIGLELLRGNIKEAVILYLTDTSNELNKLAIEARERLRREMDFKKALEYFPKYLKYERSVIEYLSRYENYANAFRRLPRQLLLMFIHSVDSYIFNRELQLRIEQGISRMENDLYTKPDFYGFPSRELSKDYDESSFVMMPLIGYNTELNSIEKQILEELSIDKESFKVKHMPELNAKGSYRAAYAPYKNLYIKDSKDIIEVGFEIPAGSYATTLLRYKGLEYKEVKELESN